MKRFFPMFPVLVAGLIASPIASLHAHPHVWVRVQSELVLEKTKVKAIRYRWTFDEAFSAFASQGLDDNDDGVLSREELQPLAQVNVESLSEYDYFSDLYENETRDGGTPVFGEPEDYWLTVEGTQLMLHFTLPVRADIDGRKRVVLDVYDPSYFVDFGFANTEPAKLVNAQQSCSIDVKKPQSLDDETAQMLAAIPADEREIPDDLMQITSTLANQVILKCN